MPIMAALATTGCATKSYVRAQTAVVDRRVSQIQIETNAEIATNANKEQADISRVDERITTTDNRLASVAATADQASSGAAQANATASQALQLGQANAVQVSANATDVARHNADLAKLEASLSYTLLETGNVMFDLDSSVLSDEAKAGVDVMIQKAAASPRGVIEVVGFTDKTGSKSYNLILSQKRADAVARYMVGQQVPLKSISLIGLGEEQTPEQLAVEVQAVDPNASQQELNALARRVRIRLYVPGSSDGARASR